MLSLKDVEHEGVEMYSDRSITALRGRPELLGDSGVEEIHKHSLACTNRPVEVETFGDIR